MLGERFLANQLKKPTISDKEKEKLKEKLRPDIEEFRRLTGKVFDQWEI